jgi:pilus assembly protein Flp/PilA
MKKLKELYNRITGRARNEKGQALVEYALLLILIALVVFAMLEGTGKGVNNAFSKINSAVNKQIG